MHNSALFKENLSYWLSDILSFRLCSQWTSVFVAGAILLPAVFASRPCPLKHPHEVVKGHEIWSRHRPGLLTKMSTVYTWEVFARGGSQGEGGS